MAKSSRDRLTARIGIVLLALILFQPYALRCEEKIDLDALLPKVEDEVRKMLLEGSIPSAAVALVHGDRILWSGGFGFSNIWAKTPAVSKTVYLIGSTFKTMSTFALMKLMEQGKFDLDDRVNDYLTEFQIRGEDPDHPVTFRHLLTHTSGLPADFGAHPVWGDTVPLDLKEYLSRSLKLRYPTESRVEYSNMAYTLIAYLIETFSGLPFKTYIRDNIWKPVEMADTYFFPRPDMEERLAVPYVVDGRTGRPVPAVRTKANVWPAGIVYGTVLDQAHWLIANLNGGVYKETRLISEKTFREIMTRQYDKFAGPISAGWLNETTGYGLTWWITKRGGDTLCAHSGSVAGYTAFLAGNLDKKNGFAILTNGHRAHANLFQLAVQVLDCMEACKLY